MNYQQIPLHDALKDLQSRSAVLIAKGNRVTIWAPGVRVPRQVRSVIQENRREVLRLLDLSEITTCVNPDLHRCSWTWAINRWSCDYCARLKPYVS